MPDKILIVDDEPDILNLVRLILERNRFRVVSVSDGEEALRKTEAEMPDLIFLDLVMPGKSGLEVCKILKGQPKTKHIPVVMFSALGRDVDRKLSAEVGADGHFTKPFTPESLTTEVRKHLDQARSAKFSKRLGVEHSKLQGKKFLLEYDPSTPYERLVRDFAMECAAHNETVIVLTKRGSTVCQALEGEKGVELVEVTTDLMLSPIIEKHREGSLGIVYDSLTDVALSASAQAAYKFAQNAIQLLADPRITAVFLFNPAAHDQKDVYSLRGLFSSQMAYGKQGITDIKIA
ncbi:response regulator [Candidatus Bathyarchaeota archaeon]|nr:response regulator [Candidatus Bathyarchaeota archaeon]